MNENKELSKTGIVNENSDLRVTRRVTEIRVQDQGVESALENQRLTAELRSLL
jgi:hypothetical protein